MSAVREYKEWIEHGCLRSQRVYRNEDFEIVDVEFKWWYDDGTPHREEHWTKTMMLNGKQKVWHSNGQLCEEEFYQDGLFENWHKSWHKNGTPFCFKNYKNGNGEGEERAWTPDGKLERHYYVRNCRNVDSFFNYKKKRSLVRIKTSLLGRCFPSLNTFLIPDLETSLS